MTLPHHRTGRDVVLLDCIINRHSQTVLLSHGVLSSAKSSRHLSVRPSQALSRVLQSTYAVGRNLRYSRTFQLSQTLRILRLRLVRLEEPLILQNHLISSSSDNSANSNSSNIAPRVNKQKCIESAVQQTIYSNFR